ncbi:MAG: maleylacetoacetate isomerase [Polyangiaceae bacterium]|nr:maleylacetoacetate isomerase [Polyangiaceae bacterium]
MASPRIVLFGYWRSSCSHRVRIALGLKGLDYETSPVNLVSGEQLADAYAERSPNRLVPCLVYDGVPYVESVAIVELLDERHPEPPLFPKNSHGRARVRALVETINATIQPLQNRRVIQRVSPDPAEQAKWATYFVSRGMEAFEAMLEASAHEGVVGPYAYGASPTAGDVVLVPEVVWAQRAGIDVTALPRTWAAFQAAMQLEAFQRAAPEKQPDAPR